MQILPINQINQYNKNNKYNTKQKNKQSSFVTFGMAINKPIKPIIETVGNSGINKLQEIIQQTFNKTLNAEQLGGIKEILEKAGIKITQKIAPKNAISLKTIISSTPTKEQLQEKYDELVSDEELISNDKKLNELYTTIDSMENLEDPIILKLGIQTIVDSYNNLIDAIPTPSNKIAEEEKTKIVNNTKKTKSNILSAWLNYYNPQSSLSKETRNARELLLRKLIFDINYSRDINFSNNFFNLIQNINTPKAGELMDMGTTLFFENEIINKYTKFNDWINDTILNHNDQDKKLIQSKINLLDTIISSPKLIKDPNIIEIRNLLNDKNCTPEKIDKLTNSLNKNINILDIIFPDKYDNYDFNSCLKSVIRNRQNKKYVSTLLLFPEEIKDFLINSKALDNQEVRKALIYLINTQDYALYVNGFHFIQNITDDEHWLKKYQDLDLSKIVKTIKNPNDCINLIFIYKNLFNNNLIPNKKTVECILNNASDYTSAPLSKFQDFVDIGICTKDILEKFLKIIDNEADPSMQLKVKNNVRNILLKLMLLDKNTLQKGKSTNFSPIFVPLCDSLNKIGNIIETSNSLDKTYSNPIKRDNILKYDYFMKTLENQLKRHQGSFNDEYKKTGAIEHLLDNAIEHKLETEKSLEKLSKKNIVNQKEKIYIMNTNDYIYRIDDILYTIWAHDYDYNYIERMQKEKNEFFLDVLKDTVKNDLRPSYLISKMCTINLLKKITDQKYTEQEYTDNYYINKETISNIIDMLHIILEDKTLRTRAKNDPNYLFNLCYMINNFHKIMVTKNQGLQKPLKIDFKKDINLKYLDIEKINKLLDKIINKPKLLRNAQLTPHYAFYPDFVIACNSTYQLIFRMKYHHLWIY